MLTVDNYHRHVTREFQEAYVEVQSEAATLEQVVGKTLSPDHGAGESYGIEVQFPKSCMDKVSKGMDVKVRSAFTSPTQTRGPVPTFAQNYVML